MDNHEALKILTEHNQWRRGMTDEYSFGADKVGEAIDTAISVLSRADGWVKVDELPKDFKGYVFTWNERTGYGLSMISDEYRLAFYITHYKIASPPKTAQQ
jgi:hypothetical protein